VLLINNINERHLLLDRVKLFFPTYWNLMVLINFVFDGILQDSNSWNGLILSQNETEAPNQHTGCCNLPRLYLQYSPSSVYRFSCSCKYSQWRMFDPSDVIRLRGFSKFWNSCYFLSPVFLAVSFYSNPTLSPYRTAISFTVPLSDAIQWQLL